MADKGTSRYINLFGNQKSCISKQIWHLKLLQLWVINLSSLFFFFFVHVCVGVYPALARWYTTRGGIQFTFPYPSLPPWAVTWAVWFKPKMKQWLFFLLVEGRLDVTGLLPGALFHAHACTAHCSDTHPGKQNEKCNLKSYVLSRCTEVIYAARWIHLRGMNRWSNLHISRSVWDTVQ